MKLRRSGASARATVSPLAGSSGALAGALYIVVHMDIRLLDRQRSKSVVN